jgi:hypothetical protein
VADSSWCRLASERIENWPVEQGVHTEPDDRRRNDPEPPTEQFAGSNAHPSACLGVAELLGLVRIGEAAEFLPRLGNLRNAHPPGTHRWLDRPPQVTGGGLQRDEAAEAGAARDHGVDGRRENLACDGGRPPARLTGGKVESDRSGYPDAGRVTGVLAARPLR